MGENASAGSPVAKSLIEWTSNNWNWLDLGLRKKDLETWTDLLSAIQRWRTPETHMPYVMQLADGLADILGLDAHDHTLLALLIACDRLSRVNSLVDLASRRSVDLPTMLGELAGAEAHDAIRFVRRSPVLRLGLIGFQSNRWGETEIKMQWTLEKLLDKAPTVGAELVDALVGPRQNTELASPDFAHVKDLQFLEKLVAGAVREQAAGINILIYGPPGTGKTELAKYLAKSNNVRLHAVGEVDDDGEEPDRYDRVNALVLALRVLQGKGDAALLFDEMEDFIGDTRPGVGDFMARRDGSKVFVNRILETNSVPVIWTTNAIGNIDDAILRRMSYVLELDYPSRQTGERIYNRVASDERVGRNGEIDRLIEAAPETATILRVAARAGRLAGSDDYQSAAAGSLVTALRGAEPDITASSKIDIKLFQSDEQLDPLVESLAISDVRDVSMLLSGPPGTGKTALAAHMARRLDLPLIEKRASDLLSKWVGETEANIAAAFRSARDNKGLLFFDEADSLMFDRSSAHTNWEVGQVNEMLSWLGRHEFPVLAATNNLSRLDPAMLRRFDYKIGLQPLQGSSLAHAFRKFFELEPPARLFDITNLTPGDFTVVKRQLRHRQKVNQTEILGSLARESELKPEAGLRMGF